jgi:hypothetical protein
MENFVARTGAIFRTAALIAQALFSPEMPGPR